MCIFLQIEKKKPKASIKWLKEPSERGGTVARTDGSL